MMSTGYLNRTYANEGHPLRRKIPVTQMPLLSREPLRDWQLFVMAFSAGFLAFYGMLS